ncbi:MAG TPA: hypothetical protein VKX46_12935 [Ktedonobacteraceae bacterium]|nr:hypothetical protein [Ktedonobacteraceae bacterium]
MMRAGTPPEMIDAGTSASVTLITVQHEVGMRRGTLGHALASLHAFANLFSPLYA